MRPLRYSINVTLDGCCDHRAGTPDEELHRYTAESLARADALLFGRVTYQLMEAGWREPATEARPEWTEPFARMINAAKKYVVSSTLSELDWNAELVRGDLETAVRRLKREPGDGLYVGGVQLPLALAELGLIDEYEFVVHPRLAGHGPTPFAGLSSYVDLRLVGQREFRSGAVALQYQPVSTPAPQPLPILVDVDEEMLTCLVRAATEGAAPDEVTPPLTPGATWTPERVAWLRDFHRDRRAGLAGTAAEVTWAVTLEDAVVGSVRLRRTDETKAFEVGIWLTRDVRGRGLGRTIMAQVLEQAKALGAVRLQASTTSGNAAAISLLRELGFTVTPDSRSHDVHADLRLA